TRSALPARTAGKRPEPPRAGPGFAGSGLADTSFHLTFRWGGDSQAPRGRALQTKSWRVRAGPRTRPVHLSSADGDQPQDTLLPESSAAWCPGREPVRVGS